MSARHEGAYVGKLYCVIRFYETNNTSQNLAFYGTTNYFPFKIDTHVYHHFLSYAEHLVGRCLQTASFSLLAFLVAEEDKIYNFGIEPPSLGEVNFDITLVTFILWLWFNPKATSYRFASQSFWAIVA